MIECPRCGYGLAGTFPPDAAAWPLETTCPECGLAIRSRMVLQDGLQLPWFVESRRELGGRRVNTFPRRCMGTLLRSLAPARFWRRVGMERSIRVRALVGYVLALLLLGALWCDAMSLSVRLRNQASWSWGGSPVSTRAGFAIGLVVQAAFFWYPGDVSAAEQQLFDAIGLTPGPGWSRAPVTPRGTWAVAPYSALARYTLPAVRRLGPPMAALLTAYAGTVVAFALLPIARRRAKVRWGHLIRAAVYGLATIWPFLAMTLLLAWIDALRAFRSLAPVLDGVSTYRMQGALGWVTMVAQLCVFVLWWHAVVHRYLRMERPLAVAASVTAIGVLAGATLPFLLVLGVESMGHILSILRVA